MGIKDSLLGIGRNVAGIAGDALSGWAEDEGFWKANGGEDPESDEHGPGGTVTDTPESAPPPQEAADDDPKTMFWDPFAIIEQLGYKDRPSNITYGTLKAMKWKVPTVNAIIKTRIEQVAAFANHPSQDRYDMGFKLFKRGKPKESLTPAERKWAEQMYTILLRTGVTDNPRGRDSFEIFTKKYIKDSLTFDQGTFEIVPNSKGLPAEWYAVDSSSIRLADSASAYMDEDLKNATRYVQVYDGMIITEYSQSELAFGIRNPTTDMRLYGYGTSELEELMNVVTSLLWAWEYNQRAFSQGSVQKGVLNFKGAIPTKQLKSFRRHWYQMLSGVENSWRTPITNADELQWIDMHQNNRDMEYNAWFDFLIKVTCAFYHMDPMEINFKYGNTGQKSAMQDSHNSEKLTDSRERGLRPLLRHFAEQINRHIIWPINENMEFGFVGLDAQTRDQVADLNQKKVKTTHTVNELRAEDGDDPIEGGDIILDPVYMQGLQQSQMEEQGLDGEEGGEDNNFQKLLEDQNDGDKDKEGAEEDRTTEGTGGRPGNEAKAAEAAKPQAGSIQKSLKKSRRQSSKIVVDVQL